jgi:hypothetical protein
MQTVTATEQATIASDRSAQAITTAQQCPDFSEDANHAGRQAATRSLTPRNALAKRLNQSLALKEHA